MVEPPLAARPFYSHDGLTNRSYHPQFGGGTGVRGGTSETTRWCLDRKKAVEVTTCEECDKWGDHGGQMEECLYDWEEKQHPKESPEDESEE
jgi:hypothetical protein